MAASSFGRVLQYDAQASFSWDEYLQEQDGEPAPNRCFKQWPTPPANEFKIGMKLEASDPRNLTSTCIATVISTQGPRLGLRLDGSDDKNDFWRLVDSSDLHPIGYCESHGGLLQPPLGFRMNQSTWPTFLQKILKDAIAAPDSCFKKEPSTPKVNEFEVGMKMEAVDRKNPHLMCPATVGAVNGDQIHVTFDGWKGAFDYWVRYDSRDLFPVGWCARTGHPLQPPGRKGDKEKKTPRGYAQRATTPEQRASLTGGTPVTLKADINNGLHGRLSRSGQQISPDRQLKIQPDTVLPPSAVASSAKTIHSSSAANVSLGLTSPVLTTRSGHSSASNAVVVEPDTSSINQSARKSVRRKTGTVCVHINRGCHCGPVLCPKRVAQLPDQLGPGSIRRVLRGAVQACVDCSYDQSTVYNLLRDGNGRVVITAVIDGKRESKRLPVIRKASTCYKLLEVLLKEIQCCPGLLSSHRHSRTTPCQLCHQLSPLGNGVSPVMSDSTSPKPINSQPSLPVHLSIKCEPTNVVPEPTAVTGPVAVPAPIVMEPLETHLSPAIIAATASKRRLPPDSEGPMAVSTSSKDNPTSNVIPPKRVAAFEAEALSESSETVVASSTTEFRPARSSADPAQWSVDDVARYIAESEPALMLYADLFRKHEIDGKALLLLTSDMMMKYMGLKLGPALKLCNTVEKLKQHK